MSQYNVYDLCCKYQGKVVRITDRTGRVYVGEITKVTRNMVWILPTSNIGGYGYGFYGGYPAYGFRRRGFGFGLALGAITGIVLASAFLW